MKMDPDQIRCTIEMIRLADPKWKTGVYPSLQKVQLGTPYCLLHSLCGYSCLILHTYESAHENIAP